MNTRTLLRLLPLATVVAPALARAEVSTVARIVGIFNVFVGLMLGVALLFYGFGLVMWFVRLGSWPSYRTEAIRSMEWSVAILFTLVVLLGIVQFFQNHQRAATYVLSAIILILIVWVILYLVVHSGSGEKEKE